MNRPTIAFVYGTPLGVGGLGVQAANALRALARVDADVHAIGPGHTSNWPAPPRVTWHVVPRPALRLLSLRPIRRYAGLHQYLGDRSLGRRVAALLGGIRPDICYAFTQVALETMQWARAHSVPGVVESPNGHIAAFRRVYLEETAAWFGESRYLGHPVSSMVERVEREYDCASHIRVSSDWSRASLAKGGVAPERIAVLQQPVDLERYRFDGRRETAGALRVCFVGSLDLRKGFVYLLRAARQLSGVNVEMVGGTVDRCSAVLLAAERDGVTLSVSPGDPRPALRRADVFVLPTLEDGSPFAVAEAMSACLPVITTTATGAAEWIRPGQTGWVVAPRSVDELAAAIQAATQRRSELPDMGLQARRDTELRVGHADEAVADWIRRL